MSISSFSLSLLYLMLHFTMGHNEIEIVEQAALKQIATFGVCVWTCGCAYVCVCVCVCAGYGEGIPGSGQQNKE